MFVFLTLIFKMMFLYYITLRRLTCVVSPLFKFISYIDFVMVLHKKDNLEPGGLLGKKHDSHNWEMSTIVKDNLF